MLNSRAYGLCKEATQDADRLRIACHSIQGGLLIDAGVEVTGSLGIGLIMAKACLGGLANVSIDMADPDLLVTSVGVSVYTDQPLLACLGGQYAGWPISANKYFAMGSGPMRMARGKEAILDHFLLRERPDFGVGILESTALPNETVIKSIAAECDLPTKSLALIAAPAGSIAGSIQVIARSVETALHKLHTLKFDLKTIFSAFGTAPLAPPSAPEDVVGGIGRTNDAILYGGQVTLWVECDQKLVDEVAEYVPSESSRDYGRPFAETFKQYEYDFYKVDPNLFSPAVVSIINRRTGLCRKFGKIRTDILRASFGL